MKKLMSNSMVCVGNFSGPDIEEGTFHEQETASDIGHTSKTIQKCPCPPIESHGAKVSDESNEKNEKDTSSND